MRDLTEEYYLSRVDLSGDEYPESGQEETDVLKLDGSITISRISNSSGEDCIEIRLTDKNTPP
jgi:hypothetical protein